MPRAALPARAGCRLLIRRIGGEGTIDMAGALLQANIERDDPHGLLLDDGEQLDDPWAHDERALCPTGGLKRKPYWQWDRSCHRPAHATHLEALEAPHERRCQTVPEAHVAALSRELLPQRLGLLQVSGVKALGEPVVDRRQHIVGLCTLALLLP